MSLTIREYQASDLDQCNALWLELTQRHRDIYEDPAIGGDNPTIQFEQYRSKPNLASLWVVEQDGAVVAMAGLLLNGEEAEIEPIVVQTYYCSHGLGTQLINHLKTEAKNRQVRYLSIRPVARNVEAIQCFYRAGFSLLGHIDMFLDLKAEDSDGWRPGITIHGCQFQF
jgi:L-amino acid N-acyltransferase YncA